MKLKVVIATEHASLRFGGEAALALHYFRVLRKRGIEAWLVAHERTRAELETLFARDRERVHFVPDTPVHRVLWRASALLPERIAYFSFGLLMRLLTQAFQRRVIRRLVRENSVSVVHQPMPVSPGEPSILCNLGAPVVIGPMNGAMDFPPAFSGMQSRWQNVTLTLGRRLTNLLNLLLPGKRRAAILLVANDRTRRALPAGAAGRIMELVENGVDLSLWTPRARAEPAGFTRYVFVGRLVDWKAVDLLLQAFHDASTKAPMMLKIIGEGRERARLERLAARLGVLAAGEERAGKAIFTGWLSQAQCAQALRASDAMVLPSLLECGGAVVLEAMATGIPVIATAWGGPADYLDASCGILVQPASRERFIEDLSAAMVQLARSPQQRAAMGSAARRKAAGEFDWEVKVERMLQIYEQATQPGAGAR